MFGGVAEFVPAAMFRVVLNSGVALVSVPENSASTTALASPVRPDTACSDTVGASTCPV